MSNDSEASELRRRAEARVTAQPQNRDRLHHELEVHQIELELQNEELRGAREASEAALERFTEIFDFAPIGYAVVAADQTIQEINHAGARLLRVDRVRFAARRARFDTFIAADDHVRLFGALATAATGERPASCEVELSGHHCTLHITATRLRDQVLLTFRDVTEEHANATRLVDSEAALREAARRKDEFLAALSHELRNPLGPIRNSLFALSRFEVDPKPAYAAYAIIDRQVAHLARLVDDLLDVTRISRGKMQIRRTLVELDELVELTVEDHRQGFVSRGVELTCEVEPQLTVIGDADRLAQVISNLLANAEKFTAQGGHVVVSARREGSVGVLRVRDDGAGIDDAVLPRLFEPFAQAPQTSDRSRGGLGLGLATVKGIVELHGGSVAITSAGLDRGTEVTLRLPLDESGRSKQPRPSSVLATPQRVLVIDDNVDGAESLKTVLVLLGHTAEVAYSGKEGIRRAREFPPDAVICDIGLPDIDGYEVATMLRSYPELGRCYLVALSGYARPSDVERAKRAGFDEHIAKPASMDRLADVLVHIASARGNAGTIEV